MKNIVLIIAMALMFYAPNWTGCQLSCNDQYASGVEVCRSIHHNPLDSGDLGMCVGNSHDVYNICMNGCQGLN